MGKKKRKYVGENLKLFMDFLPEEIYRNLNKEDYRNYKEYRRYQRFIGESNIRVDKMEKEITKLQTKINNEKLKIKGVDSEHSGWEQKMVLHYDGISYLHKDLHFWCSTSPRKRTSKSKKTKDGNVRLNKKDTEFGIQKNSYKGEELKVNHLWYSRIENSKIRKDIYLGHESDIRNFLSDVLNENWGKDDISEVKLELKTILSEYTRYKVYHSNWKQFKLDTHNLKSVKEWCVEIGDRRYEWSGRVKK